jgi:hypothetical protein
MTPHRRTQKLVAALAAAILVVSGALTTAQPAAAAPDRSPAPPAPSGGRIDVTLSEAQYQQLLAEGRRRAGQTPTPPPSPQQAQRPGQATGARPVPTKLRADDVLEAERQARRTAAQQYAADVSAGVPEDVSTTAAAPIGEQPNAAALQQCMTDSAEDEFGRVLNRFVYCQRTEWEFRLFRIVRGVRIPMGETDFVLELFVQGDDLNRRIRSFARVQPDSVEHDYRLWYDQLFVAPSLPLSLITNCSGENYEPTDVCFATRGPVVLPFVVWDNNDDWYYWDVYNEAGSGVGRDQISYNRFYLQLQVDSYNRPTGRNQPRQIRCDSATYFRRFNDVWPHACIFSEGLSFLTFSISKDPWPEVAEHIRFAQDNPDPTKTYPLLVPPGFPPPRDKNIPGKFTNEENDRGLHRIREAVDPEYQANRNHVRGACYKEGPEAVWYLETGLPNRPLPNIEECDEYPMASTLEGAAHPDYDFSVRAVDAGQNGLAGNRLQDFYRDDRVLSYDFGLPHLANDQFWMQIVD